MQERERDIHARQAAVTAREEAAAAREQRCNEVDKASQRCAVEAVARADNAQAEARKAVSYRFSSNFMLATHGCHLFESQVPVAPLLKQPCFHELAAVAFAYLFDASRITALPPDHIAQREGGPCDVWAMPTGAGMASQSGCYLPFLPASERAGVLQGVDGWVGSVVVVCTLICGFCRAGACPACLGGCVLHRWVGCGFLAGLVVGVCVLICVGG